MIISYGICICNEEVESRNLLEFLLENKREVDEVVVLLDDPKCPETLREYLCQLSEQLKVKLTISQFDGNFADWKNKLNSLCTGDWIFNLDPDESINPNLLRYIPVIAEQCEERGAECVVLARCNTVEGITREDLHRWRWWQTEEGYINFPDYQYRMYKNIDRIKWEGKVHERVHGFKTLTVLPHEDRDLVIYHRKSIEKQRSQNNFYNTL